METRLYKIGDLARLSGVPIKTIRHYSDIGVLPPSAITEAGFRLYSNADRARLESIRTLREAGLSLSAINELLHDEITVLPALELQLSAVEENLSRLQRQQTLLRAALRRGEDGALAYLNRSQVLTKLDAAGRERFLDEHLGRAFEGVPADTAWKANFWRGAVLDLPEEIDDHQFEAWLELADLMLDESFLRHLNEIGKSFWANLREPDGIERWRECQDQVLADVQEAMQQGELPQEHLRDGFVQRYIDVNADFMNRVGDPTFPRELLAMIKEATDSRAQRYWELIGILKGWPTEATQRVNQAHEWLIEGLRKQVAQTL